MAVEQHHEIGAAGVVEVAGGNQYEPPGSELLFDHVEAVLGGDHVEADRRFVQ